MGSPYRNYPFAYLLYVVLPLAYGHLNLNIEFVIGCIVGGTVGVTAMCCFIVGKEADRRIDWTDSDE